MSEENYAYGYCGMPCALCSRYRTDGKSRCPGCSVNGYYTDVCKVHHCCVGKGLIHCGTCSDFRCARLSKMGEFSDLHTDNVKEKTCTFIASNGFESWYSDYSQKAEMLTEALQNFNDGRMKRYLCELFICNDISTLRKIMSEAETLSGCVKEKARGFKEVAQNVLNK